MRKVVILGGGIAGMTAAHELIERGFEVEVYERNTIYPGGKARSVDVPNTNSQDPDLFLPGEHGFRFFPGFYKHIIDTLKRIPFQTSDGKWQKGGCFGNLTHTTRILLARYNKQPIETLANFPRKLKDWVLVFRTMTHGVNSGLTKKEKLFFVKKLLQLMCSSIERRFAEYEQIGWWEYMEADEFSENYQNLLVNGLTRSLVASRAKTASTKTGGNIFLQLLFVMFKPLAHADRVLNGPTNDQFLHPWLAHLKQKGVQYHFGRNVAEIKVDQENNRIIEATVIDQDKKETKVTGDYFILAVPVERAAELINEKVLYLDPKLELIKTLAGSVSWMNGLQYYLNTDVKIAPGHTIYSDSQWALTSISQIQFWKNYNLSQRYNGKVKGILSVDISDWLWTTYKGKLARHCDYDEIKNLVWEQLKTSLNVNGQEVLKDEMIEYWYLDRDIRTANYLGHFWEMPGDGSFTVENRNAEPLLVNTVDSWRLRPNATTQISNFFLAGDYVRTNTDLATMEGANEAARRAVNAILEKTDSKSPLCKVWPLTEPALFLPVKSWDKVRFRHGKPFTGRLPLWLTLVMVIWALFFLVFYICNVIISSILSLFINER